MPRAGFSLLELRFTACPTPKICRGKLSGLIAMTLCWLAGPLLAQGNPARIHGLPFTRFYSFEEIGSISRGARLGFDSLGRLTVVQTGTCMVLNDTTWIDMADKHAVGPPMQRIVFDAGGQAYFGSFASWGRVEVSPEGKLRPRSLVPAVYPDWVMASNFTEVVTMDSGVFFAGFNGIAYWDRKAERHEFFESPQLSRIFTIGDTLYVLARTQGIQVQILDIKNRSLQPVDEAGLEGARIDQVTPLDAQRVLMATVEGRLLSFDGRNFSAWAKVPGEQPSGRVSALQTLVDGSVAVAISGKGLFFYSAEGEIRSSLTTPEYHRITDLATRESGVLWLSTETGIEKILYQNPLTAFGQRLGLPISWPQVARWNDRIVVASGGRLYQSLPSAAGEATRFEYVSGQPEAETWGLAAQGTQMLVGNLTGVFARDLDGRFHSVLPGINVARLVMVHPKLCYVIGTSEITAMAWTDGSGWKECAQRVPGLGYPANVHATKKSVWIELGANRAARVALKDGRLDVRVFDNFPWSAMAWINIGIVGDTVVLSGLPQGRVFFDEKSEELTESPRLKQMLDQAPLPIARMIQDEKGTIWATHEQGVLTMHAQGEGYQIDRTSFGTINDHFPLIHLLPDGDVWLATGQSLYHVDQHRGRESNPAFRPILVSAIDGRTEQQLFEPQLSDNIHALTFSQNSLVFRFFSGTYDWYQPPVYEFRLQRGTDIWSPLGNGSLLTLTDLREGSYRLGIKLVNSNSPVRETLSFAFVIAPPWYRTWQAYAVYILGGALTVLGLMGWSAHRGRLRNAALEGLVQERTDALRIAMQQLNEETRNAATLAERDRLAGEIHDSLQQGLSGLMLQLDATLKLRNLSNDVRSRLSVARNMVSFTRHEVQHAVWDMETPLLESTDLGEALRKITALIGPGTTRIQVTTAGQPAPLSPATKHHLLRIAQEAITNAVRHAAASTITVALGYTPTAVSLSVTDDGNGFVPQDILNNGIGHFGLRGLRGRAGKIDGDLQIRSAPGEGTTVTVTVRTSTPAYSHAH